MPEAQNRLTPEEVELYMTAGIWVTARDLSRAEKQQALAEGRALGLSSWTGDHASGESSLVPLAPGESLEKIKVVVPPGEVATFCLSSDREHEVWARFHDAQLRDACRGLVPEATARVRDASRGLAVEIARLLPAATIGPLTVVLERLSLGDDTDAARRCLAAHQAWPAARRLLPLLEPWFADGERRAERYADAVLELARTAAQDEDLYRDAQRMLVRIACRAKLGRDVGRESLEGSRALRALADQRQAARAECEAAWARLATPAFAQSLTTLRRATLHALSSAIRCMAGIDGAAETVLDLYARVARLELDADRQRLRALVPSLPPAHPATEHLVALLDWIEPDRAPSLSTDALRARVAAVARSSARSWLGEGAADDVMKRAEADAEAWLLEDASWWLGYWRPHRFCPKCRAVMVAALAEPSEACPSCKTWAWKEEG